MTLYDGGTSQDPDSSIPFVSIYDKILKLERKKTFILTSEINLEVLMSELIGTAVTQGNNVEPGS